MVNTSLISVGLLFVTILLVTACKSEYAYDAYDKPVQKIPTCGEKEILHWVWSLDGKKEYMCIPDLFGCGDLVEPGQLRNDECEARYDCYVPCYSSCIECKDIICGGCLPKPDVVESGKLPDSVRCDFEEYQKMIGMDDIEMWTCKMVVSL